MQKLMLILLVMLCFLAIGCNGDDDSPNEKGALIDTDQDGVIDDQDWCNNTPNGDPVGQNGCSLFWNFVAAGDNHTISIKPGGSLFVWGSNSSGQLTDYGDGKNIPTKIGGHTYWISAAAGEEHTVLVKEGGSLYACGDNSEGQLGDGTYIEKSRLTQIGTDENWSFVAAGKSHTIAIKTDGSIYTWGNNFSGQLGNGTSGSNTNENTPIEIKTDNKWMIVAAGNEHTVGIKTDGSLYAWGGNFYGQLGDGTNKSKNIPTQVGTDKTWRFVAAGGEHTVAIKTDGSLYTWGQNHYGQLGDGTSGANTHKNIPTQVGTNINWSLVAAGSDHSLAIKTDGSLYTWGHNFSGQLGDDSFVDRSTPTQIGTFTSWSSIAAGNSHSLAISENDYLFSWGNNSHGQLGHGPTVGIKNTPWKIEPNDLSY